MAVSYLQDAECDGDSMVSEWRELAARDLDDRDAPFPRGATRPTPDAVHIVRQMIDRGFNSPLTSSAGRLFDAVAAILGVRQIVSFEGQAAIELEALASSVGDDDKIYPIAPLLAVGCKPFGELETRSSVVDTRPLIRALFGDRRANVDAAVIARRFHHTFAAMIVETCCQIAASSGLDRIVLSGGVLMNAVLSDQVSKQLSRRGLVVFQHHVVPPNDGGLSLGQLAIAARRLL